MKYTFIITLLFVVSSCSKVPAPSIVSPSYNTQVSNTEYGERPDKYPMILKKYLIKVIKNYKEAKIEFVNEPNKMSLKHLGEVYTGYRLCLSVNEKTGDYYRGWKNHFFMINDNKVVLHLYDSGLLTIPFEHCVTRNIERTMLVQDIPDEIDDIDSLSVKSDDIKVKAPTIEEMDKVQPKLAYKEKDPYARESLNKYILCIINNKEFTYVFNESKKIFYFSNLNDKKYYEPSFNETFIAAKDSDVIININRVSGSIKIQSEASTLEGNCDILDRTKF